MKWQIATLLLSELPRSIENDDQGEISNIRKCYDQNETISHSNAPRIKSILKISNPELPKLYDSRKGNLYLHQFTAVCN